MVLLGLGYWTLHVLLPSSWILLSREVLVQASVHSQSLEYVVHGGLLGNLADDAGLLSDIAACIALGDTLVLDRLLWLRHLERGCALLCSDDLVALLPQSLKRIRRVSV